MMQDPYRRLARRMLGYGLASLSGPLVAVTLTPLYARLLRTDGYALLDLCAAVGTLMLLLGMLGLPVAMGTLVHDGGDEAQSRRVVTTAAVIGVVCSLPLALILAVSARSVAGLALGAEDRAVLLYLTALNTPLAVLLTILQVGLRLRLAARSDAVLSVGYVVLLGSLNVLLVAILGWGVLGVQAATLLATAAMAMLGLWLARDMLREGPSRALWAPLVHGGLRYLPGGLSLWAMAYLSRLALPGHGIELDHRGLYAMAYRLASILTLATVPFQNAWGPLALATARDTHAPRTAGKILTYFMAVGLGLALFLALFAREILIVFASDAFAPAARYVGLLSYVPLASGAFVAVGVGAYLARRTDLLGWATALGAGTSLALNAGLIPWLGVWGAVWATVLGFAVAPLALYFAAQRVHPLPFEPSRVLAALGVQAVLMLTGWAIERGDPWLDLPLKLLLLAAYLVALLLLRVIEPQEVRSLARFFSRRSQLMDLLPRHRRRP